MKTTLLASVAVLCLSGAALAADPADTSARLDALEKKMANIESLLQKIAGQAAPAPAGAPAAPAATPVAAPAASPSPAPAAAPAGPKMVPGWTARVYMAPADLVTPPDSDLGRFAVKNSRFNLNLGAENGVPGQAPKAYLLEGNYVADKAGEYQFTVEVSPTMKARTIGGMRTPYPVACNTWFAVEGQKVIQPGLANVDRDPVTWLNKITLQPGVYKVALWVACIPNDTSDEPMTHGVQFRVRKPGANFEAPGPDDVLRKEGA